MVARGAWIWKSCFPVANQKSSSPFFSSALSRTARFCSSKEGPEGSAPGTIVGYRRRDATAIQTRPGKLANLPMVSLTDSGLSPGNSEVRQIMVGVQESLYFAHLGDGLRKLFSQILLTNIEDCAGTLHLLLHNADGTPMMGTASMAAPAHGHLARFVTHFRLDEAVDFRIFIGLLKVRSSGSIAATVIQTWPDQFATLPAVRLQRRRE